jgi:hypothetical protein
LQGEVFVARNVANVVSHMDLSMMSVLQYAVETLEVPHIVVCGHYDCGGVRASLVNKDHRPPLEQWLRNIRDGACCWEQVQLPSRVVSDLLRNITNCTMRLVFQWSASTPTSSGPSPTRSSGYGCITVL